MVFDPSERVKGRSETVVSFYKTYVTVNEKYYGAANAAAYEEVLEWVAGKFASFLGE